MQCWIINNVEHLFFQDSSMNKTLNNFCNNIHYCSKAWGQYFIFSKKLVFIQQGIVKFIETVIEKVDS